MVEMSKREMRKFLKHGTLTGKLATVRKDGSPHVVPIWFMVDDGNNRNGDIVFSTSDMSVKAKNIQRDDRISICIDDQIPPFSFVTVFGTAKLQRHNQNDLVEWATKIAGRYTGRKKAKSYGKRNSTQGELLVRIKPTRVIAEKAIAGWD
jgi:PPOX class probable F420-dependent enzyme